MWKINLSNIHNVGKKTQTLSKCSRNWAWSLVVQSPRLVLYCSGALELSFALFAADLFVFNGTEYSKGSAMELSWDNMGQSFCWWTSAFFVKIPQCCIVRVED